MRRLIWRVRLAAKWLVLRAGWGAALIEYCDDCGREQPLVWWSEDPLWTHVTGIRDGGGVYCPECFDRRADALGLLLQWRPTVLEVRSQANIEASA